MLKTNVKRRKTRSDKFPLTLHKTGQFCKKIKGKPCYVGSDKKLALQRYLEQGSDVTSFGYILANQAIGVLIQTSLPGLIGIRKIHGHPQLAGKGLMPGKLFAVKEMIGQVQTAYPNTAWFETTLREVISANCYLWGALVTDSKEWEIIKPREIGVLDRLCRRFALQYPQGVGCKKMCPIRLGKRSAGGYNAGRIMLSPLTKTNSGVSGKATPASNGKYGLERPR